MENEVLAKLLVHGKYVSSLGEVEQFSKEAHEKNESLLSVIIKAKKLEPSNLAIFLATRFNLPYMDLDIFDIDFLPSEIDVKIVEKTKILPLKKQGNILFVAVSDPTNQNMLNQLKFQLGVTNIACVVVEEDKLHNLIAKYLQSKGANFAQDIDLQGEDLIISEQSQEDKINDSEIEDAPVVKFIQAVLLDAIKLKVSDIHLEPYEKKYRVRFRLDGSLYESRSVPIVLKDKIASRIKILSNLDISEKRVPQDGRFKTKISADRTVDFRVSTLPTIWGEKIVIRILDSSPANLDIDKLGYDKEQKELLLKAVKKPYGMVLVTGPTGSGKTISLYSCLAVLNQEDVNICTAEDPAEINLTGVNQVNMNDKAGLNFANTLKSFLRQDPDVILVGEIRDLETADIAIKAAQTGHMVLSTLHTNDAPKTITRLLNMGVKPFNIASSVALITAQRLARKLCPECKQIENIPNEILIESGMSPDELIGYKTKWHTYKPVGCKDCGEKGYKGRVGIYQVMPVTDEIKRIILSEGTDLDIAAAAKQDGVLTLREAGLLKVKLGITSLEEILANTNID